MGLFFIKRRFDPLATLGVTSWQIFAMLELLPGTVAWGDPG
jgi:hypothetical protein